MRLLRTSGREAAALLGLALLWGCHGPDIPGPDDVTAAARTGWSGPDGSISALRAGDAGGRRVVFVHGTPGDATNWARYVDAPLPGAEFIALDRPGFGESEPAGAVPSLARQAAALEPILLDAAGRPSVLVGHSLGGPILLRAAVDYPERVAGLLVLAGNLSPELEKLRWYNYAGRVVSPFLSRAMRNSNAELFPHKDELEELVPLLEQIRCPVAIVHGTEDDLVPFENAEYLRNALPDDVSVRFVRLDGDGHFFIWSNPGPVWEALEWLLEQTGAPTVER